LPLALIPARTAPHTNPRGTIAAGKPASSFIDLLYQASFRPGVGFTHKAEVAFLILQ
jgi:hypothetical protein